MKKEINLFENDFDELWSYILANAEKNPPETFDKAYDLFVELMRKNAAYFT